MPLLILPVEHVQQQHSGECLAASVAMVLNFLGAPVAYRRLVKVLDIIPDAGTPAFKVGNVKQLGVHVRYQHGSIEQLRRHLIAGEPCIVFVQTKDLPYRDDDTAHAIVLVGMDDNNFYVDDPEFAESPLRVPLGDFDLAWLEHDEMYAVLTR